MVIGHTVTGFTDKLKNGEPFKAFYTGTNDILVYGVAHPESRGLYNIGGKEEIMKSAWEKIAQDYSMIKE
jgi:hypothetical protein